MKRIEFGCICELAAIMDDYIWDNTFEDEYPVVSAYVKCEEAKLLVERLIEFGNPIGAILELEDYEMSHYDKEYVVYLSEDGVTCERNHSKDGYYNGGGDISFVHEDCSSKLLSHIQSKVIYEFAVGECDECYDEDYDYDCDCDCDCDEEICNENIDVKSDDDGYYITVRCNLDADEAMEIIKDMENRMERMNDMFREMDYFRRLLKF